MSNTAHEDQFSDPTPEEDEAFEALERANYPEIPDSSTDNPDIHVTLSDDPRGIHVAVHDGQRCVYAGVPEQSPSGQAAPSLMEIRELWGAATEATGGDGLEAMQHFACAVLHRYGSAK